MESEIKPSVTPYDRWLTLIQYPLAFFGVLGLFMIAVTVIGPLNGMFYSPAESLIYGLMAIICLPLGIFGVPILLIASLLMRRAALKQAPHKDYPTWANYFGLLGWLLLLFELYIQTASLVGA